MVTVAGRVPVRRRAAVRLRSTPGRLSLMMVALLALGLGAGVAGVLGVQERSGLVDGVTARSGVLAVAAQDLYRSLSDADATAANAFLANGLESPELRNRYDTDIAGATAALAVASGGSADDAASTSAIARITSGLPVYTGLIETARTYNRQGVPLGSAYLREASGLMRQTLLPAAQNLYRAVSARLAAARGGAAEFPWFAVPLGLLTVAGLVAAQMWLAQRTNRVLNAGLVAATAAALIALVWLGVASISAAGHLDASRRDGSAQVDLLAEARIAALQARADEALTLIARGSGGAYEQDYTGIMTKLLGTDGSGGLLGQARARATDAETRQVAESAAANAKAWLTVHQQLRTLDNDGKYNQAVTMAIGSEPGSAATAFNRLDGDLAKAIAHNGDRFTREATAAAGALSKVAIVIAVLTALLVVGVVAGVQQRIAEYR